MTTQVSFKWECHPKAEALINNIIEESCKSNPFIAQLQHDLKIQTSSRLFDWTDHVIAGYTPELENDLLEFGFVSDIAGPSYRVFHHPGAKLPMVVVNDHDQPIVGVAVHVDSIADFLMVRGMTGWIEGGFLSSYRRCCVSTKNNVSLWAVERRGSRSMEPTYSDEGHIERYLEAQEKWQCRPRDLEDEDEAMARTITLAEEIVNLVGRDMASWIVLEIERKYWQARNTAGEFQKNRQDRLGMGWGNHDHHTFRSSRKRFAQLVRLFEMLGFHCRERYYAGKAGGWGAQIMENMESNLVVFLDLDLANEEIEIDFAHHMLPELNHYSTVGLWCALHGDSILKAGMHHLEAQFQFEDLSKDLGHQGIGMMEPFSNFPYLKQAFTHGEVWHVDPKRIQKLLNNSQITQAESDKFNSYGAIGSHMENLQRREGYKGFNQDNVSYIIKRTDPRKL